MAMLKRFLEEYQEAYEDSEDARANYSRRRDKRMGDFDIEEEDTNTDEE